MIKTLLSCDAYFPHSMELKEYRLKPVQDSINETVDDAVKAT